jgi:hypothetical protein
VAARRAAMKVGGSSGEAYSTPGASAAA